MRIAEAGAQAYWCPHPPIVGAQTAVSNAWLGVFKAYTWMLLFIPPCILSELSFAATIPTAPARILEIHDPVVEVALAPGRIEHSTSALPAPASPLVQRAQQLLQELGFYFGSTEGRLNDDIDLAVRQFQRRSGMEPDGRIDETLISRLEFASQANRLVNRLDNLRQEQKKRARQALASSSETRRLVSGVRRLGVADPTRDSRSCLAAPTVQCLLLEAIEAAKSVHRVHFRDWVLGEVLTVQARVGSLKGALTTAGLIDDPRLVIVGLKRMVEAAAVAGDLDAARTTAEMIPDTWIQIEARISIVKGDLRDGRVAQARMLATELSDDILAADKGRARVGLLVRLANALSGGGSITGATRVLERAMLIADPPGLREQVEPADIAAIAAGYARVGRTVRAQQLLAQTADAAARESALIQAAYARAMTGDLIGARAFADSIQTARYRLSALVRIAEAQRDRRQLHAAASTLPEAMAASKLIGTGLNYARSDALSRIASIWTSLGEFAKAAALAGDIPDDRVRSSTFWTIEARSLANGSRAGQREPVAVRETNSIASALDRAWVLANAAALYAETGQSLPARRLFDQGVRIVWDTKNSWARAQALVRYADVLHILERFNHLKRKVDEAS